MKRNLIRYVMTFFLIFSCFAVEKIQAYHMAYEYHYGIVDKVENYFGKYSVKFTDSADFKKLNLEGKSSFVGYESLSNIKQSDIIMYALDQNGDIEFIQKIAQVDKLGISVNKNMNRIYGKVSYITISSFEKEKFLYGDGKEFLVDKDAKIFDLRSIQTGPIVNQNSINSILPTNDLSKISNLKSNDALIFQDGKLSSKFILILNQNKQINHTIVDKPDFTDYNLKVTRVGNRNKISILVELPYYIDEVHLVKMDQNNMDLKLKNGDKFEVISKETTGHEYTFEIAEATFTIKK